MPNVKVATTFKCRWVPNRSAPRVYTVTDAARIMCRVTRAGATMAQIQATYARVCKDVPAKKSNEAEQALEQSAAALQANTAELLTAYQLFQIVNGLVTAVIFLSTFVPFARPLRPAAQAARTGLQHALTTNITRRAANEALFARVQQAAANESRYLRQSNM